MEKIYDMAVRFTAPDADWLWCDYAPSGRLTIVVKTLLSADGGRKCLGLAEEFCEKACAKSQVPVG